MAKARIEKEWRLWAIIAGIFVLIVAFLYWESRPPTEGGELLYRVTKVLDDGKLDLKGGGKSLQFKLVALEVPPAQADAFKEFLTQALKDNWVRIKAVREEAGGVGVGFVFLSGEDLHARVIRQGLAKMDREAKGFDVRPYIELELEAKQARRGMWASSSERAK
ncbi:MAG: thermonuclease family protein [Thermodesulfobacteriota bacterium]